MITIKASGPLKSYLNGSSQVDVEAAGLSVFETLKLINIPAEMIALVLINDQPAAKDTILKDQDFVQILAVIGGG